MGDRRGIGFRLAELLAMAGYTPSDAGRRVGIPHKVMVDICAGRRRMSTDQARRLATIVGAAAERLRVEAVREVVGV